MFGWNCPASAQNTPSTAETLWQTDLSTLSPRESEPNYDAAVEALFEAYEGASGLPIHPGAKAKVGLKVYAESGQGLATPIPLTQAVIKALVKRGYPSENIFIVGLNALRLRMTGYLPPLDGRKYLFEKQRVYVLESERYYESNWFYDSPLPSRFDPILAPKSVEYDDKTDNKAVVQDDRKSFLATPLFLDADFWINLPVYTDHAVLGVNGALVNATLWNASNTSRFFRSPANAAAAVAEMAAIPELQMTWLFSISSLERYQFIGGPYFNALYTVSEPTLILGSDPVAMDSWVLKKIDRHRVDAGFQKVSENIRTLEFAEALGVGSRKDHEPARVQP